VGIAGHVFTTNEILNIPDAYEDYRFNQEFDKSSGFRTRAILCCPVIAHAGYTVGVLQIINKKDPTGKAAPADLFFDKEDEAAMEGFAIKIGVHLLQAATFEDVRHAEAQLPLLSLIMGAFKEEIAMSKTMDVLVEIVCDKIDAERATVWLADEATKELFTRSATGTGEIRIPWDAGVAGMCFGGSQPINIPDAVADPRFNSDVDKKTGFKTRNILALPIVSGEGRAIGVIQAVNKKIDEEDLADPELDYDDYFFTEDDEWYGAKLATMAAFSLEYSRRFEAAQ
jgi:adenylate cyclase